MHRKLILFVLGLVMLGGGVVRNAGGAESTNSAAVLSIYEGPAEITGTIYAKDSNPKKELYKFKRTATRTGSKVNVLREYLNPDGTTAARERAFYDGNQLLAYELDELQIGASGSARIQRDPANSGKGKILFEYNKDEANASSVKKNDESLRGETLVGDMIASFLQQHWGELFRGEKVKCRYIVVPRRETVGFTFVRDSDATISGHPAMVVRMEATSPIIAAMVDPIYFTVEKESQHRVSQYLGRVVPKVKKGEKWEDLDALVLFDWK